MEQRLLALRRTALDTDVAHARQAVAEDHGFPDWDSLMEEVESRSSRTRDAFFAACAAGDLDRLGDLLARDPRLARECDDTRATGLHLAVRHPGAVRLLLEHGADPSVREAGDNALPLHFAAAYGAFEAVRALLDAGSDVHGDGDLHRMNVIGWATCFADPRPDVVDLLIERGARHHVFSAIALGDLGLLRRVVEDDPEAIRRRLSRFEQEQTALHYVVAPADGLVGGTFRTGSHYRMLDLLIELGADLEARDAAGRTPLAIAMLRGDVEAMRRLYDAGAKLPGAVEPTRPDTRLGLLTSVGKLTPMVSVQNVDATVDWYRSIGFELIGSHGEEGVTDWACVGMGEAEIMFSPINQSSKGGVPLSLWFRTDRIDELHSLLERRQLARARAFLAGQVSDEPEVRFTSGLHTAFYGQREFGIRDPNGIQLYFHQPVEVGSDESPAPAAQPEA